MMQGLRMTFCAALTGVIAACSTNDTAGSTFETENSVATIVVTQLDGTPAARHAVFIHDENFTARVSLDMATGEFVQSESEAHAQMTDENGLLSLDSIPAGNYVVKAQSLDSAKVLLGANRFSIPKELPDSSIQISVALADPVSLSGSVESEKFPIFVKIRGTDYWTVVDSLGKFTFPQLPQGEFEVVAVYKTEVLAEQTVDLNEKGGEALILKDSVVSSSSAAASSSSADTVPEIVSFVFEDFENGISGWYTSTSKYATIDISAIFDEERKSVVAQLKTVNDSVGGWTLMGRYIGETDLSGLDSVSFWARGVAGEHISFAFDVIADSSASYSTGKAWRHFDLDTTWQRYVLSPKSLLPADSIGGNIGWGNVRDHVTNITIFGGTKGGAWIDDIVFYGVDSTVVLHKNSENN